MRIGEVPFAKKSVKELAAQEARVTAHYDRQSDAFYTSGRLLDDALRRRAQGAARRGSEKQILRLRGILDSLGWESGQVPEALREACGFRIVEDPASEFILK